MAARGDQAYQGKTRGMLRVIAFQPGGVDVSLQVVDADEGKLLGEGQALGSVDTDEQGAGQAGPMGDTDAIQPVKLHPGIL